MTLTTTTEKYYSDGSELIPAEVAAREEEDFSVNTTGGYTVDQEGLVNNYATPPETYEASYPTPRQQNRYLFWGTIALLLVTGLVGVSFIIS